MPQRIWCLACGRVELKSWAAVIRKHPKWQWCGMLQQFAATCNSRRHIFLDMPNIVSHWRRQGEGPMMPLSPPPPPFRCPPVRITYSYLCFVSFLTRDLARCLPQYPSPPPPPQHTHTHTFKILVPPVNDRENCLFLFGGGGGGCLHTGNIEFSI